jgi:hypothetical protein
MIRNAGPSPADPTVPATTSPSVRTNPAAMHFDEWAGIYYIVEDLGAHAWHEDVIFDIWFRRYRTHAEASPGRKPRRYAWEDGEVCEYRLERGRPVRRTALLIHLQKRVMRAPGPDVLAAERYWILSNGFAGQDRVTPWSVRALAGHGREAGDEPALPQRFPPRARCSACAHVGQGAPGRHAVKHGQACQRGAGPACPPEHATSTARSRLLHHPGRDHRRARHA